MLDTIINWSEAWGPLIPLAVMIIHKPARLRIEIIGYYVIVALVLNLTATIMREFYFSMPSWLRNNNILYNLHSISRVLFFSWYLYSVRKPKYPWIYTLLWAIYLVFVAMQFIFIQSPLFLNTHLFGAESILLLLLTLFFLFRSMQDDSQVNWLTHPAFLVCAGICLFESTSFFIFLFFYPLFEKNQEFGLLTMSIHNIMYVILCVMLALALYKSRRRTQHP